MRLSTEGLYVVLIVSPFRAVYFHGRYLFIPRRERERRDERLMNVVSIEMTIVDAKWTC